MEFSNFLHMVNIYIVLAQKMIWRPMNHSLFLEKVYPRLIEIDMKFLKK